MQIRIYVVVCVALVAMSFLFQFPVRNGQRLDVQLILYDAESRPFDNFTSLQWRWSSSDQLLLPTPQNMALSHQEGKGQTIIAANTSSSAHTVQMLEMSRRIVHG